MANRNRNSGRETDVDAGRGGRGSSDVDSGIGGGVDKSRGCTSLVKRRVVCSRGRMFGKYLSESFQQKK